MAEAGAGGGGAAGRTGGGGREGGRQREGVRPRTGTGEVDTHTLVSRVATDKADGVVIWMCQGMSWQHLNQPCVAG